MTPRQQRFADEYLVDQVGARAARRAGYASGTAAKTASELLQDPEIKAYVEGKFAERRLVSGITEDQVVAEHVHLAFSDPLDVFDPVTGAMLPLQEWPPEARRAVASLEVELRDDGARIAKIRWWDKNSALDRLTRKLGWAVKVDHAHELGPKLEEIIRAAARVPVRRTIPAPPAPASTGEG